jgi:hypothetical protein
MVMTKRLKSPEHLGFLESQESGLKYPITDDNLMSERGMTAPLEPLSVAKDLFGRDPEGGRGFKGADPVGPLSWTTNEAVRVFMRQVGLRGIMARDMYVESLGKFLSKSGRLSEKSFQGV